jgi:hypothetical protein
VASLKGLGVIGVVANQRRSIVRACGSVPSNTRIERTIGAGILVKERRKMAPLAAHPPCYAGVDRVGQIGADTVVRRERLRGR